MGMVGMSWASSAINIRHISGLTRVFIRTRYSPDKVYAFFADPSEPSLLRRPHHTNLPERLKDLVIVVAVSTMAQGMTSFIRQPRGRHGMVMCTRDIFAFTRTVDDAVLPLLVQQMMLDGIDIK
jgi:hypothetical protein